MKLIFNHSFSIYDGKNPLIYLEAETENESAKYMFENGWVPYRDKWYQTKSARLKTAPISAKRKYSIRSLNITETTSNPNIQKPIDIFWGRVNFYEDQILYSVMNNVVDKKSYGTLSFYYLIDKFQKEYEYIYITDYFDCFDYKKKLSGFQYWNGFMWVN